MNSSSIRKETNPVNSITSLHHSFDAVLATEIKSTEVAILIHHFQFWISINKRLKRHQYEGRTWMYQTLQEISAAFPYWSIYQIERFINKAVSLKILRKGHFNKSKLDRTVWYAFENEEKFGISRFHEMDFSESGNGDREIANCIICTDSDTDKNKKESTKEKVGASAPRAPSSFSEKNIQRAPNVETSEADHQKLVEKYGEEITEQCYQKLSEWKESTPKNKWKKGDYRSILRWVFDAVQEEKAKKAKIEKVMQDVSIPEENKKLAKKVAENFNMIVAPRKGYRIEALNKHIEIIGEGQDNTFFLNYTEKGFEEQLTGALKKRNLL